MSKSQSAGKSSRSSIAAGLTVGTGRMLLMQSLMELKLLLRNGEQILLSLLVPLGMLVVFIKVPFIQIEGSRADFFVPGIIALALMSSAFTGQAISTGFDRHYGVLKRLGATALPREILLLGKTVSVVFVQILQVTVLIATGLLLGWRPDGNPLVIALLVASSTAAFSGLAFLIAGRLPAMTTLALANIVWFLLLIFGGIAFPLSELGSAGEILKFTPSGALSEGLRQVFTGADGFPTQSILTLLGWALITLPLSAKLFSWQ